MRGALVLGEVALALVLLVGAGLLSRSFGKMMDVDLGFRPDGVLTYSLTFPAAKFKEAAQLPRLYDEMLERARALPGVRSAALAQSLPMSGASYTDFTIDGRPPRAARPDATPEDLQPFAVSPDYFSTMRIPLRRRRLLQAIDGPTAPGVAVINEEMARRYFDGGRDPIGQRLTSGDPADATSTWYTIVGVVGNVAQEGVTAKPYAQLYRSLAQAPSRGVYVALRSDNDPTRLAASARPRLSVLLLAGFSSIALLLAAIGIYGVMAYTVSQRTREIGVRMALGADPSNVKRLVVRQGMRPALIGVAVGIAASMAASRLIASLLYGVSSVDPLTFVAVPIFLTAIALLATYLPARRATRVPLTVALQGE